MAILRFLLFNLAVASMFGSKLRSYGQLRPTVPNRPNYLHWIEDLLSSDIIPKTCKNGDNAVPSSSSPFDLSIDASDIYHGPPVFLGAVRDGEEFDFCMCNPPFFETMEEAKLSPKTSYGRTPKEMVCPHGEKAFISRIIEDSVALKQNFWSFYKSLEHFW
ncbi:hypothetical protein Dsin_025816 [Dipteronia sinensis]|uniref:Uncharacterized protein n=1 Tax=Dipteronia sinensis TaxID=43782 RepID=A0AAE0DXH1_9ROSI|nr:hypothetical protein Dsin_025816 [Dipteronia sinensis]